VAKWELWCWDAEPGHGATGTLEQSRGAGKLHGYDMGVDRRLLF